jgi:hypothetical protein
MLGLANQPKITSESVHRFFQGLDRMAQEAEKGPDFSLTTKHLNIVLDLWRIESHYRNVVDRNEISAPKVLSLIDDYFDDCGMEKGRPTRGSSAWKVLVETYG